MRKKVSNRKKSNFTMRKRNQRGFTFIETLISFAVLATSIVGVVAMQALAKKSSFDAVQRALATSLANDIVQRMRVNTAGVTAGTYSGTYSGFETNSSLNRCQSTASLCSSAQIAASDLYEWQMAIFGADVVQSQSNVGGLISPTACISHLAGAVSVVISWSGRTQTTDAAASKTEGSLASTCGSASTSRRQVYIDTFIF
jgi:type IV pilus assembly protein PilV